MWMPEKVRYTPQEYLALERAAETRSEYLDGQIVAMIGAKRAHNLITVNVSGELRARLKGHSCQTYTGSMRVRIPATNFYVYPDVVVVCGDSRLEDDQFDTLLNPTLVVEVLSSSTGAYDRDEKFHANQTLPSLREYILIAQDKPRVEQFVKLDNDLWPLRVTTSLEADVELTSIGCTLPMGEIYYLVDVV